MQNGMQDAAALTEMEYFFSLHLDYFQLLYKSVQDILQINPLPLSH